MSDDASPLPWTSQQWASLRAVVQESARRARVASSFLPLTGPLPRDQATVPSQWMEEPEIKKEDRQRGEAEHRLEVRAGRTLHLTTISCNVYLRGTDVADPELGVAKSMLRRAAEVLGRLEDAIIFNGLPENVEYPMRGDVAVVEPLIYSVSGGRGLTGLLEAPGILSPEDRKAKREAERNLIEKVPDNQSDVAKAAEALSNLSKELSDIREKAKSGGMYVPVTEASGEKDVMSAIVGAIQKLEQVGHFRPFAVVLGDELFKAAHTPTPNMVLPSDRILPFLEGGPLLRSSTLPPGEGVVIALAGSPVELVVGTDMDVKFLQTTLEPRYVLRVYERFVLRIKQLDAICVIRS
jgi:uncharacterized linocin/CFP29 family protein